MTYIEREDKIKEFIRELERLWLKYPRQRFGQLLFNHTRFGTRMELGRVLDTFHFQDDDVLKDIQEKLK